MVAQQVLVLFVVVRIRVRQLFSSVTFTGKDFSRCLFPCGKPVRSVWIKGHVIHNQTVPIIRLLITFQLLTGYPFVIPKPLCLLSCLYSAHYPIYAPIHKTIIINIILLLK